MQNNDDLINDILSELDGQKNVQPTEISAPQEEETVAPETEPVQEIIPEETNASVNEDIFPGDYQNYYQESSDSPETAKDTYAENGGYPDNENYQDNYGYPPAEEYPPQRPTHKKKKKKKKRNRLPGVLILTTFIFAVSIVLAMVIIGFGKDMLGIGKSDTTKLIIIKDGATTEQIAEQLKDEGIIKSPKFFVLFSRLRKADSMYIAGEHFIRANMAYETIIQNLTTDEE